MIKRSMDQVFAAIGAAMSETHGRTLEQIDRVGDAAISAARHQVSITLQDYNPYQGADPGDAEWRYRKALEQALHGPLAVPGALRAWLLSQESEPNELTESERVLAAAWVAATERARAEGMRGLADSHTAWFEVRAMQPQRPTVPPKPKGPAQGDLF